MFFRYDGYCGFDDLSYFHDFDEFDEFHGYKCQKKGS